MENMAFATTVVVNGHGTAIVTDTAMNTKVGKIAKMIITNDSPETPIQRKLADVGKTLGITCLIICAFIFVIGLIKKISPIEMFMTSVGLAVAAIPEGLPAIVTIVLSIGVTKMAKKNSIIRKLPAVETLGSSTIIASDKTGTLTENKMQVIEIKNMNGKNITDKDSNFILELGTMCTDVEIDEEKKEFLGDPTEVAICKKMYETGKSKKTLYNEMERVGEIPFDSERKMMTTIHKVDGKFRIITKGAPDILIKKCTRYYLNGKSFNMLQSNIAKIEEQNNYMASKALRVLAVAYVDVNTLPSNITANEIENNLVFTRVNRNDRSAKRRR